MRVHDVHQRPLRNLRLSVTDRCNLRCAYCMPEEEYAWLQHDAVLTFEEMGFLVDVFGGLGVDKVRITGGEPLLRKDLDHLVAQIAAKPHVRDLALTTNGVLLAGKARALRAAGLSRVTVSLDTLDAETFRMLTRRDNLDRVLEGIHAAATEFGSLKIDTVLMRGVNEDQIEPLLELGRTVNAEVRFIEYMDVGGATRWSMDKVVSRRDLLDQLERQHGGVVPLDENTSAPADRYRLPDGTVFGIISSTTQPFCSDCDRSRLTADGHWFTCLYGRTGTDLMTPLRRGASAAELRALLSSVWRSRQDRGAEDRLTTRERTPLATQAELRANPRLEMHTRGG